MGDILQSRRTKPVATGLLAAMMSFAAAAALAQDQDAVVAIVADQVRSQGFACENPSAAERLEAESKPDEPVYLLKCKDAEYRVHIIPDQAAEVTKVK